MSKHKILKEQPKKLFKLTQFIEQNVITLDDVADMIPGIMHVNSRKDLGIQYLSKQGCDMLRYSMEELQSLGAEVLMRHQSDFTTKIIYPKLLRELAKDDENHVIPFFQDWQHKKGENPVFHFTSTKILNDKQTISISLFPEKIEYLTKRVNDMFGINTIFDTFFSRFAQLTKREKEILQLLGKELTRKEISMQLFIAERTVKKHCENIFRKLGTTKRTKISKIAMAFSTFQ
jgi:DNA-binding CsgD family transcriptional regulator